MKDDSLSKRSRPRKNTDEQQPRKNTDEHGCKNSEHGDYYF